MTTQTRTLTTIAAAAIALTTALSTVSGQPPLGRGPGPGQGRGFGPGGPLPVLRQLNLTEAQREQVRALTEQQRQDESPARKVAELQRALHAAVFADAPDSTQIDQLRAAIAEAEAAALAARIDLQLKIAEILTPEQRKQARELTERRPGRARPGAM